MTAAATCAFENRVGKTVNGVITQYLVADDVNPTGLPQVVEELTGPIGAGVVSRTYTYGLQRISQNLSPTVSGNSTWTPSFYGYDGFGTVRQLTNTAGEVTDSYEYDAFGNSFTKTGSTPNNYLYRGEQYDSDLGLYYLRARYYNPATGRFLSRDPENGHIKDPASLHKYLYANGDPVNRIDPFGRESMLESVIIFVKETLPMVVFAARLACYTEGLTILVAEVLHLAVTGSFFNPGIPWPAYGLPCALAGLPYPPSPPGGW